VGVLAVAEIASRLILPGFAAVAVKTRWFAGFGVATGGATTGCRRILSRWRSGVNGCCVTCRNKLWSQSSISTVYHGDSIENEHCAVISIFLLSAPVRRLYVASTLCKHHLLTLTLYPSMLRSFIDIYMILPFRIQNIPLLYTAHTTPAIEFNRLPRIFDRLDYLFCIMTTTTTATTASTTVTLSNGVEMPVVAMGTAPLMTSEEDSSQFHPRNSFHGFLPEQACRSVHAALAMNVHKQHLPSTLLSDPQQPASSSSSSMPVHIDTALVYRTHPHIRQVMCNALATGRKKRSDVFLTTKIFHPCYSFGPEDLGHCMPPDPECENMTYNDVYKLVYKQFQQSLHECGVGYFDLVLLHWPGIQRESDDEKDKMYIGVNARHRLAAWHALEDCYAKGWTRAIGVSNFSEYHLGELQVINEGTKRAQATKNKRLAIQPHVNQMEASVFIQHKGILEYCLKNGIVPMAYSPLGRGVTHVTSDQTVQTIAAKHGKDVGQVAMKYLLQKGYGSVVFWTTNVERICSNHQLHDFELTQDELEALDGLNRSDGSGTWGLTSPYDIP